MKRKEEAESAFIHIHLIWCRVLLQCKAATAFVIVKQHSSVCSTFNVFTSVDLLVTINDHLPTQQTNMTTRQNTDTHTIQLAVTWLNIRNSETGKQDKN